MKHLLFISCIFVCLAAQGQSYSQWLDRSADYMEANRPDSAAYAIQRAISADATNPNTPFLLMNLGILQHQMGQLNEAYMSYTASLQNNPDSMVVLHGRASLLCDMERFDEAMTDYNTIIRNNPSDVEAYYRRGLLFLEKNDREGAEADFSAANEIDADNVFSQLSKGLLYKLDDDWEAAEKVYTSLIRMGRHFASGYYLNRAECYVNLEQFGKAAADLHAVEPYEKENPYFYFLRGRVRLYQYDKFAASEDFEKALALGYDESIAKEWIAKSK